jgi:O-antigen ligase
MLFLLTVWAVYPGKRWLSNRLHVAFLYFTLVMLTCWLSSPYPSEIGQEVWEDYLKIAVLFVVLVTTVRDEEFLRQILFWYFVALFLYQSHSLLEYLSGRFQYRMGTVRLEGVDKSFADPNSFSATLLHALPFLIPFWLTPRRASSRFVIVGYVLLSLLCIQLTGSRRAFLGVVFLGLIVIWRSQRRWQYLALAVLLSPVAFGMLPENLQNRFLTIIDPSLGPKNAEESAYSRIEFFLQAMALWQQNPLTGVGPGTFGHAVGHGMQAHSLYGQTPAELGALGVVAVIVIVWCFRRNAREAARLYQEHPWWEQDFTYHVIQSAWLAVVLLLFMGIGGHNLYRYNWLWFGAFQLIALEFVRRRAAEEAPVYEEAPLTPEPDGGLFAARQAA